LLVMPGKLSIPALGSLIIRGRVPQPRLTGRVALDARPDVRLRVPQEEARLAVVRPARVDPRHGVLAGVLCRRARRAGSTAAGCGRRSRTWHPWSLRRGSRTGVRSLELRRRSLNFAGDRKITGTSVGDSRTRCAWVGMPGSRVLQRHILMTLTSVVAASTRERKESTDGKIDLTPQCVRRRTISSGTDGTHRSVQHTHRGNLSAVRDFTLEALSGGPGESHPRAPTERSVTVSRHSALLIAFRRRC
jgi:hypothetical protein